MKTHNSMLAIYFFTKKSNKYETKTCAMRIYMHILSFSPPFKWTCPAVHCFRVDNGALKDFYCFHFSPSIQQI